MTVTALDVRNEYTGVATQTIFNYTFLIFTNQDLNVYITPSGQDADDAADLTTAYTVDSGTLGNPSGGFITLNSGVSAGDLVTIVSSIVEDRTTDYQNSGDFLPDTVNNDFDRVVSIAKQVDDRANRTLAFPESLQNATALTLPLPVAGQYVIWNPAADGLINAGAPGIVIPGTNVGTATAMVADTSLIIGDFVFTNGYLSSGDGGDNSYEIVAAATGPNNGFSYLDLANGLQAKGLFPQGIANVKQAGAVGDWSDGSQTGTDDTVAIQAAISSTNMQILIPVGNYRITAPLVVPGSGKNIMGSGNKLAITITGDHINGPVLKMGGNQCSFSNFIINASDTRNAVAANTDNYGIQLGTDTTTFLTSSLVENIIITRQPSDGIRFAGEGVGSIFSQVSCQYNRGHGFYCESGVGVGNPSPERNGGAKFLNCRAQENGGNGYNGAQLNGSNYRHLIENMEAIDNAWNTGLTGLIDAQIYIGGQNMAVKQCGLGNNRWAATTMGIGDTRLAKLGAGDGISIRTGAGYIDITNNRFIDLRENVVTSSGIDGLTIANNYNTPLQTVGFRIGSGCLNLSVDEPTGNYTTTLISESGAGELRLGNFLYEIYPSSSLGQHFLLNKSLSSTVSSGILRCTSSVVSAIGEGDLTDTIGNLRFVGTNVVQDGWKITIINQNAYNLEISDNSGGGGNIYNKTGASVSLLVNQAITYTVRDGNCYES